jgi:hypothetical protein
MSEAARLIGIFWDPKPVFEDLAARPRWWPPIALATLVALAFLAAFSHWIGWEQFLEQELRTNPRLEQLPAEQQRAIIAQQTRIVGVLSYAGAAAGTVVVCLLVAAVFLYVFRSFAGADLSFRQSFAVTAYALLPNALASALAIVVVTQANPADFDLRNPLMLNAAWLVRSENAPAWLRTLAASFDLFSIWTMLLLALGYSVAARKIRYSKSLALVVVVWLVYVAVKTGWSALVG